MASSHAFVSLSEHNKLKDELQKCQAELKKEKEMTLSLRKELSQITDLVKTCPVKIETFENIRETMGSSSQRNDNRKRTRPVKVALLNVSTVILEQDGAIMKKEEDSNSPAVETSSIEVTEDIRQEQQDTRINEKVTVENMKTVYMNLEADREKDNNLETESSELDSDDSDFFTENRKRKKFTKKSLESSECKKRNVQQHMNTHNDVSLNRDDDTFELQRDNNESSDSNDDDSNQETAFNSLGKKKNIKNKDLLECPHCGRQCATKHNLEIHLRIHTGERPFECLECDKKFIRAVYLRTHVKTVHRGEHPYHCLECEKKFTQSSSLNLHIKTVHRGLKPFSCDFCDQTFSRNTDLVIHRRTHTGIKPFSCGICGKSYSQSRYLKRHEKIHQGINEKEVNKHK